MYKIFTYFTQWYIYVILKYPISLSITQYRIQRIISYYIILCLLSKIKFTLLFFLLFLHQFRYRYLCFYFISILSLRSLFKVLQPHHLSKTFVCYLTISLFHIFSMSLYMPIETYQKLSNLFDTIYHFVFTNFYLL